MASRQQAPLEPPSATMAESRFPSRTLFTHYMLIAVSILAAVALIILLLQLAVDVLLLLFAGLLVAIFLRTISDWVSEHTPLSPGWALFAVVLVLLALAAGGGWLFAPRISVQVDQLTTQLPKAVDRLRQQLAQFGWGQWLI